MIPLELPLNERGVHIKDIMDAKWRREVDELLARAAIPPYQIEYGEKEYVIRLPADLVEPEDLPRLLDFLLIENVRRKASFTEDEIASLADDVDRAAWERLRPMVEEKLGRRLP